MTLIDWKDEFISLLFPLNPKHMHIELAYNLKDKYLPKSIFKYYKFCPNSINNFKKGSVWLSSPQSFNDPYDCALSIDFDGILLKKMNENWNLFFEKAERFKTYPQEIINKAKESKDPIRTIFNYSLKKQKNISDENELNLLFDEIIGKQKKELNDAFQNNIKNTYKICSFTTNLTSILLWSHYSNNHSGFCIEYDISQFSKMDERRKSLYPVIYTENLFDASEYVEKLKEQESNILYLIQASLYKSIDWSYEDEWRLIFSHGIYPEECEYIMGNPKAIYLGSRIRNEDFESIIPIINGKGIPYYQMEISKNQFKLIPKAY